jgi:hypothetical protein
MKSLTKRDWILSRSTPSTLVAEVFEKRGLVAAWACCPKVPWHMRDRNQSHVLIKLIFTCRAARISLLGDPIS